MHVREGKKEDLPQVLELVKELAEFEKALDQVENTVELMEKDGFGPQPIFGFFVVEASGKILGTAIYYYRYSTWKGKRLYLEDIVVTKDQRGKGIGKLLFEATAKKAKTTNCSGMVWQVLDWNEAAINFYKKYDASFDGEWVNCALNDTQLQQLST